MSPNLRKRLVRCVIVFAVVAAIREWSIRRHEDDLVAWPRAE
jgi:hypothetical protein